MGLEWRGRRAIGSCGCEFDEGPLNMQIPGISNLERRHHRLLSRRRFANRMLKAIALWFIFAFVGLTIGMAGYATFEHMSFADAYVNAAMILSGMGPMGELKTTAGKIFAGSYAIFSGLLIVIATGFVLAPLFHRLLHHFHVETDHRD
jgi:hypothetical protein